MVKRILFLILAVCTLSAVAREQIPLTSWKFHFGDVPGAVQIGFDDSGWKRVRVPHDWAIDQPFDMRIDMQSIQVLEDGDKAPKMRTGRTGALPAFGIGYYRTEVVSEASMIGKRIRVEFDGAMSLSKVYLNGQYVGEWPYGYSSFAFDLTDKWNYSGKNILVVRLENKPESSRWYPGAGLYRHVRLIVTDPVSIGHWGTFVTTPEVTGQKGKVQISTRIENHTGKAKEVRLENLILDANGKMVGRKTLKKRADCGDCVFEQSLTIARPSLWSVEEPCLYQLVSNVYMDNKLVDTDITNFGFRTIRFDKDEGFFLNEKPVKLKGVCLHHDLGPLGTAVNVRALERQLEIMQEMGCNAIRTSHNPPAPELLDLCDRMGFLVQVEAFDEWQIGKTTNGYHYYFDEWSERDLQAMVRRDRNHPSVIMWSIGNEIREQGKEYGAKVARRLTEICHREDPTRPTTAGFNGHVAAIKNGLADAVDLVGFNYKPHDYKKQHAAHPDFVIYGSETASTVSSRGEYKFPVTEKRGAYYEDYHVSSYDLEYPNWASTPDTEFEQQDDCDFVLGEFVWTGFDYLGEPTPFNAGTPARSSYFGIVDLAGMKKDRFFLYQSKWSNCPVLHLLPHWNWAERLGQNVPVFCYTNYPEAELFVNGKSMGSKKKDRKDKYERYRLMWKDVIYQPGEIKVVAYDEKGMPADSTCIRTAGTTHRLRATVDRREITADGKDLAYVMIEVVDKEGNLCPRADNMLFFDIEGAASLKAACNGNPTDQTSFSSSYMRAFNGKLMLVVEATETTGQAILKVYGGHLLPVIEKIDVINK
ncbi:beta-galactosidase GalB [Bacteroides cellulosilyticus]|uniref:beta-galactosidase GalB n=1 Tax=Bacteroides cellulosilyticus TaxID=246787 RepID=UPI0032C1529A